MRAIAANTRADFKRETKSPEKSPKKPTHLAAPEAARVKQSIKFKKC